MLRFSDIKFLFVECHQSPSLEESTVEGCPRSVNPPRKARSGEDSYFDMELKIKM